MNRLMRIAGFAVGVSGALAGPAGAGTWRVGSWLGWEAAALGDIKAELESVAEDARTDWKDLLDTWGETGTDEVTGKTPRGGFGFGAELVRMVSPRMGWGLRVGRATVQGEQAGFGGTGSSGESYRESWTFDLGITPVMGGVTLEGGDPDGWSWRGAFFAGPAYADARFRQAGRYVDPVLLVDKSWNGEGTLTGNTIAFEVGGQVARRIVGDVSVFAEAAYLAARIKRMKWRNGFDVDADGIMEYAAGNTLLSNKNRQPLVFDFSGLALRVGVEARFGASAPSGNTEVYGE